MTGPLQLGDHQTLIIEASSPRELIMESRWVPDGPQPRTHWHPTQHESFLVLEGELTVCVGTAPARVLGPGELLEIPPRTAHRMWNASSARTRARWTITPRQRSEEMFHRLAGGTNLIQSLIIVWRYRHEIRLGNP